MPLPPPGHKTNKTPEHPFMCRLKSKINKVNILMEQIFEIANCDLVVTDINKGVMDYEMNRKFAKKMEKLSKEFASMSIQISEVASSISDKVDAALDKKEVKQGIIFVEEVTEAKQKSDLANIDPGTKFETHFQIQTTY